ncbi:hypothetical protein GCM10009547_44100 [Sporichthya brevicatena]|uniref:Uncharacterized protein n=1 Tax=Sporichthya brevicatena TaxID=171442 RepID=A0ABN1HA38_9ACTN
MKIGQYSRSVGLVAAGLVAGGVLFSAVGAVAADEPAGTPAPSSAPSEPSGDTTPKATPGARSGVTPDGAARQHPCPDDENGGRGQGIGGESRRGVAPGERGGAAEQGASPASFVLSGSLT